MSAILIPSPIRFTTLIVFGVDETPLFPPHEDVLLVNGVHAVFRQDAARGFFVRGESVERRQFAPVGGVGVWGSAGEGDGVGESGVRV
jgi:hypothetical protein